MTTLHRDNRANEDNAPEWISAAIQENEGATLIKAGDFDCTQYKTKTKENGAAMPVYYRIFGKNNSLFICSFTTDMQQEQDKKAIPEVERIIQSIKIN